MIPIPSFHDTSRPITPRPADKLLVSFNGVDCDDVMRRGAPEDMNIIRNQGIWKVTSFALDSFLISNAAATMLDAGGLTPSAVAIGIFSAGCLLQIDRTFGSRYFFEKGKSEQGREGLALGKSGDGLAYGVMVATRLVIGVSKALLLGSVAAQIVFASEIRTVKEQSVAATNAPIVAAVERKLGDAEKSLAAQAKADADAERIAVRETEAFRHLDLANTRQIGRKNSSSEKRDVTQQQVQTYEARATAAHDKAAHSAQELQAFLSHKNELARQWIVTDSRYVAPPQGLLADETALLAATQGNLFARGGMVLFDVLLVAIELWSVIGLLGARGTIFSSNLVRDYLVQRNTISRELVAAINGPVSPANDNELELFGELNVAQDPSATEPPDLFGLAATAVPQKRGQGRPKGSKNRPKPTNGAGHE